MSLELWKPVVGYEGIYSVSNLGRIRRDSRGAGTRIGHILRQQFITSRRYLGVTLYHGTIKTKKSVRVHKIVMDAFVGIRKDNMQVNHIDGNKENNCLNNLEYVTPRENNLHAFRLGLNKPRIGIAHNLAKLDDAKVIEIRRLKSYSNVSLNRLARMFHVSKKTILNVVKGRIWKHVQFS